MNFCVGSTALWRFDRGFEMASLTSQLIVSLIDKVSGPAKGAAGALKAVDAASKNVGAGSAKGMQTLAASLNDVAKAKKALNAVPFKGINLAEEFKGMKLTSRELRLITKDFEALRSAMRGMKASDQLSYLGTWKTRTIADLREMRQEMAATERARDKMFRGWRGGARAAAGALGVGGGAYMANRVGRNTIGAAASNEREGARDYLAGLNATDTAKLQGRSLSLSGQYPSVDARTMHESLRDAAMSMRSVEKAFEIGDVMARGLTVLQSLKDKTSAIEESRKFFKALDTLGKNVDPEEVKALYNGYVKAMGVEGAELNMGDLLNVARLSKSAGPGLSNRFLTSTAPGLMGDMGSHRFGTALGSEVAQIIGGRSTKEAKAQQQAFGLRDRKGKFIDDRKVMTDPDKFAWENLIPALEKKKINPDDIPAVTKAMNGIFSNQVVADLFTKLITQRQQYQGKAEQYEKAPGIEAAKVLPTKDPFVALEGVFAQLRNSASLLAEGPLAKASDLMNSFTASIAAFNNTLANNPKLKENLGTGAAVAGGTAALAGGALLARKGWRWLLDKGPMTGGGGAAAAGGSGATSAGSRVLGSATRAGSATFGALFGSALNPNRIIRTPEIERMQREYDAERAAKGPQNPWDHFKIRRDQSRSYGKDFTLGSDGGFARSPSFVPPSGLKSFYGRDARRLGTNAPTIDRQRQVEPGASELRGFTKPERTSDQRQLVRPADPAWIGQIAQVLQNLPEALKAAKREEQPSVRPVETPKSAKQQSAWKTGTSPLPAKPAPWPATTIPPIKGLDQSGEAAAGAASTFGAYKNAADTALDALKAKVRATMQEIQQMMNTNLGGPTITPKFAPVSGGGGAAAPGGGSKQARLETTREKQQAMFADGGVGPVTV